MDLDRLKELFEKKFTKTAGCWKWEASLTSTGYGQFNDRQFLKTNKAHRVSYFLYKGDPTGSNVLHTCDNPPCVNPDHLYLGTQSNNMKDAYDRKQRLPMRGHLSGNSKLSSKQVRDIRDDNRRLVDIAEEYGMHHSQISRIRTGKSYRNVR